MVPNSQIDSKYQGLTSRDAEERYRLYGPNEIHRANYFLPLKAFVQKFNSPLLWIILAAAIFSYLTGAQTNAYILVSMVMLSVCLDFVNTYRSEAAVKKLIKRVHRTVVVIRDGRQNDISPEEIVPGDCVVVTAGTIIPADGYVLEEKDLYVNESALTGESMPVPKSSGSPNKPDQIDRRRPDVLMMGTNVVSGFAVMRVIMTGAKTAYGAVVDRLAGQEGPSDFEKQLRSFSVFLMRMTAVMVAAVFILNLIGHKGVFDSLLFAVAIAVGLTPELLPVIMTVSLSRGALRMYRKAVIVKRLPAIQTLGRMEILCTDKTGTLTENKIAVVHYLNVEGQSDEEVKRLAGWSSRFHTGVYNPLDEAIAAECTQAVGGAEKIDEVPFDFERRRETMVIRDQGRGRMLIKGATEAVLNACDRVRRSEAVVLCDANETKGIVAAADKMGAQGYKVLALAVRDVAAESRNYEPADEHNAVFYGFVVLMDPAKKTAREAIDEFEELGVEIKILTGDSAILTEKICRDLDLKIRGTVTGLELASVPEEKWSEIAEKNTIFARIDPMQKEKIIIALKKKAVVGFMGDGINDAPALKAADVGISVDNAVDVAKETADIVLLRQSLRVLRDGIVEGRRTFSNTTKYLLMGLSSNFGNMLSMVLAAAFLPFLPMLPTQILINNFMYDLSQLSLATDNVGREEIRKPAIWDLGHIRRFMFVMGPVSSVFDILTFVVLLRIFDFGAARFQTGWFIESMATQVLVIYFIRSKGWPFGKNRPSILLVINTLFIVALAWVMPFIPWSRDVGFVRLPGSALAVLGGIVLMYLALIQGVKIWFYRREANRKPMTA